MYFWYFLVFGGRANYSSTGFAFLVWLICLVFLVFRGRANYSIYRIGIFGMFDIFDMFLYLEGGPTILLQGWYLFFACFCIWREGQLFLYRIGMFGI